MFEQTCIPSRPLNAHEVRAVAVRAFCSIPTVKKWLRGEPVRGVCAARLERAVSVLGYLDKPEVR